MGLRLRGDPHWGYRLSPEALRDALAIDRIDNLFLDGVFEALLSRLTLGLELLAKLAGQKLVPKSEARTDRKPDRSALLSHPKITVAPGSLDFWTTP